MHKLTRSTLKLNGQDYDAGTGQPIGAPNQASIDGVIRKPKPNKTHPIQHLSVHPSPSNTLMRSAVRKPPKSTRLIGSVNTPIGLTTKSPAIESSTMVGRIDPGLAKRAKTFRPSRQISRFGATLRSATNVPEIKAALNSSAEAASERVKSIARPAGANLLERAVENANSHEQPKLSRKEVRRQNGRPKVRGHGAAVVLVSLMGVLVIAYAIYANMPNVMVKVASVRAGFSAVLPSDRPAGYSLASVDYQPSTVSFNFSSNTDSRKFTITEHSSNWDSATLLSSEIVPTDGSKYQELSLDGQNIFLYGNDQAAWVTNGILFQVNGNNSLSTNQILQLATTL